MNDKKLKLMVLVCLIVVMFGVWLSNLASENMKESSLENFDLKSQQDQISKLHNLVTTVLEMKNQTGSPSILDTLNDQISLPAINRNPFVLPKKPEALARSVPKSSVKTPKPDEDKKESPVEYSVKESLKQFDLTGIIYDKANPCAILNDEVVVMGDTIGGFLITEIDEKGVTLISSKNELVLKAPEFE